MDELGLYYTLVKMGLVGSRGYVIIVSLVTSAHPARKPVGLPPFGLLFTEGPSSLPLSLISLEESACGPGKEMGGGGERR